MVGGGKGIVFPLSVPKGVSSVGASVMNVACVTEDVLSEIILF